MKRCHFTLLEIMLVIFLIAMAGGIIGVHISRGVEKQEFQSGVNRLYIELESCHRLALNMQADWIAILEKKGNQFVLRRDCKEAGQSTTAAWTIPCDLRWNQEKVSRISFLFASSGKVSPTGFLEIIGTHQKSQWLIPEKFSVSEGVSTDLPRPDEEIDYKKR